MSRSRGPVSFLLATDMKVYHQVLPLMTSIWLVATIPCRYNAVSAVITVLTSGQPTIDSQVVKGLRRRRLSLTNTRRRRRQPATHDVGVIKDADTGPISSFTCAYNRRV